MKIVTVLVVVILFLGVAFSGCTTSNKYYQITIKDKFTHGSDQFIITDADQTLKIGRLCDVGTYQNSCYNTFIQNKTYTVKVGIEDNIFNNDIVITDLVRGPE